MNPKVCKNINFKSESFREVLPPRPPFRSWKYKGCSKSIKGKFCWHIFYFFIFKQIFNQNLMTGCDCWGSDGRLDTKIDQIDTRHIHMSYASYVIIWHIMTYDAYDIWIWHMSNLSILVSKRPSGPQQSHPVIRFWLKSTSTILS